MHPGRAFAWDDRDAMLRFVADESFATIALPAPGVVHVPLTVDDGVIRFHLARRNRMAGRIDGQRVVASVLGRHAYQSANWYEEPDHVPTWLYEAVEIEGVARAMDDRALVLQVDALVEAMERKYSAQRQWSRERMVPDKFASMMRAIVGFEVKIEEVRGTVKFNQAKSTADIAATKAGQRAAGHDAVAQAVEEWAG